MMDIVKIITLAAVAATFVLAVTAEIMSARQVRNESKMNERRKNP